VTLRAWERRYRLLEPRRSDGNYRRYSAHDVGVVRWVKSRVDSGESISRVAVELEAQRRKKQSRLHSWWMPAGAARAPLTGSKRSDTLPRRRRPST
jgi:DNA-binding transcriptional MerR regulator